MQCLDCGKKLSSRDRLKQHMETQHSDNPPTFTCQCGKVFKSQRGLKSHEMLHTGGIKCGLCPFEGTHGEQMRAHRRSQHGADRLQCSQCETTFTHRSSLKPRAQPILRFFSVRFLGRPSPPRFFLKT